MNRVKKAKQKMDLPLVSVIMGVYNNERTLQQAVESILQQTLQDLELIICDDGSSDRSFTLICGLAAMDKRVKMLKNARNLGAAAARNNCLAIAAGRYIAIMDADDISLPDRLKRQYEYLEAHPEIDFVSASASLFDEHGIYNEISYPALPVKEDFLFVLPFVHGSMMFRKPALDAVHGYRVCKQTYRAEDYDLLVRLYAANLQGANLPEVLYSIREDGNSRKRRKYRYRFDEAGVRYQSFKLLGLMPKGWPFVIKPLIVGLIPANVLDLLKNAYYKRKPIDRKK